MAWRATHLVLLGALAGCDGESPSSGEVADASDAASSGGGATASSTGSMPEPDAGADADGSDGASLDASDPDAADSAGDCPPTFITKCGSLLFADDFSSGDFKPEWTVVGGTWTVENGKLVGSSPAGEADPNIGHMVAADRVIIQFSFSFSGTGDPGARLNHKDATNPQHLLAVRMNQGPPSTAVLREMSGWASTTTSKTLDTEPTPFVAGQTYVAVLEVFDQKVSFSVDGSALLAGTTVDQSAFPKNHLVLAAYGASVTYDDVKIWEALAP